MKLLVIFNLVLFSFNPYVILGQISPHSEKVKDHFKSEIIFEVNKFKHNHLDDDGHRHPVNLPHSNIKCALCKIKTNFNAKYLKINLPQDVYFQFIINQEDSSESWLYLPSFVDKIQFSNTNEEQANIIYYLPLKLFSEKVYNLELNLDFINKDSKKRIKIKTFPEDAELFIAKEKIKKNGAILFDSLHPGTYNLTIKKEFYKSIDTTIKGFPSGNNEWEFRLKSLYGSTFFNTDFES